MVAKIIIKQLHVAEIEPRTKFKCTIANLCASKTLCSKMLKYNTERQWDIVANTNLKKILSSQFVCQGNGFLSWGICSQRHDSRTDELHCVTNIVSFGK
jgi:hypothetical protein